jgi:hypothetical protein
MTAWDETAPGKLRCAICGAPLGVGFSKKQIARKEKRARRRKQMTLFE